MTTRKKKPAKPDTTYVILDYSGVVEYPGYSEMTTVLERVDSFVTTAVGSGHDLKALLGFTDNSPLIGILKINWQKHVLNYLSPDDFEIKAYGVKK